MIKAKEIAARMNTRDGRLFELFCKAVCQATEVLRLWDETRDERDEQNADEYLDFDGATVFDSVNKKLLSALDEMSDALFPDLKLEEEKSC